MSGTFLRLTHEQLKTVRAGGPKAERFRTELMEKYPPNTVVRDLTGKPIGFTLRTRDAVKLSEKAMRAFLQGGEERKKVIEAYRYTYGTGPKLLTPLGEPIDHDAAPGKVGIEQAAAGWRELTGGVRVRVNEEGQHVEVEIKGTHQENARKLLVSRLNKSVQYVGSWRVQDDGRKRCDIIAGTPAEIEAALEEAKAKELAPVALDLVEGATTIETGEEVEGSTVEELAAKAGEVLEAHGVATDDQGAEPAP